MSSSSPLQERFSRPIPWRYGDLLALLGVGIAGLALVGLAFYSSNRTDDLASQVRWVNVGVVGVLLLGVGNLLWLITGRRVVGELRRVVVARVAALASAGTSDTPAVRDESFVSSRSMTKYHLRSCPLVRGKAVRASSLATHDRRGRRPCGVCLAPELGDV